MFYTSSKQVLLSTYLCSALVHKCFMKTWVLNLEMFRVLPHALYSLAPYDYFLFPKLKTISFLYERDFMLNLHTETQGCGYRYLNDMYTLDKPYSHVFSKKIQIYF